MGTSYSAAELVGKVGAFSKAQPVVAQTAVRDATFIANATIDAELAAATHGTRRLSGVGKKGARLSVRRVISSQRGVLTASGPWQLVERDTPRHDISARGQRIGKRGRRLAGAKALVIGGNFYASAKNTGGSKGKAPWAKGTVAARPLAAKAFEAVEAAALREVFH